jgi:hypothetical protein
MCRFTEPTNGATVLRFRGGFGNNPSLSTEELAGLGRGCTLMAQLGSVASKEGAKIRQLGTKLRMTLGGLARAVGLTTHTIWRLESESVFDPRRGTL